MPQAARVGDKTGHLTPLGPGPGSSNVYIGGLPAWRAEADKHVCTVPNPGDGPHGEGTVTLGSKSVFINNCRAARQGDVITEKNGPPNAIVSGCENVLIGD
jgi:uncharacterized Zn-binding protein involved in type VI secretion